MPESPKITHGLGPKSEIYMHLNPVDCLVLKCTDIEALCNRDRIKEIGIELKSFCASQANYQLFSH